MKFSHACYFTFCLIAIMGVTQVADALGGKNIVRAEFPEDGVVCYQGEYSNHISCVKVSE